MKRVTGSIAFAFPVVLLGIVYIGDFYRYPAHTTPVFFGLLIAWAFACRFLGFDEGRAEAEEGRRGLFASGALAWWIRAAALVAGVLIYLLLSDRTYQGMRILPKRTTEIEVALVAAIALLAPLVIRPPRASISLGLLVAAGVLVRACGLWQWDINPAKRDMLALVLSALDAFTSGDNPYGFHQMQIGSQVPLTYPPGLWMAHLPAYALGLDIRWTGVVADGAVALLLGGVAVRLRARTLGPVLAALAAYLFLPDVHWNGIYAEPNIDWAVLAALCAAVLSRRPLAVGLAMGLALATRPFNVVLVPFLAIWMLRDFGARIAWRAGLVAGLVASALYVPFVVADPDAFYVGTVRWLLEYGPAHARWFKGMLGAFGPLYANGLSAWMLPAQLGSVGALAALSAWRLRSTRGLFALLAVAYALFVAFNSIIWMSFWIGVCVLAVAGTVAAGLSKRGEDGAAPGWFWSWKGPAALGAEIAASLVVLSSAAFLGLALVRHFSEDGREEIREALLERTRSGDRILDRSGWRVAFMKMPPILEPAKLPRGVSLATTPFEQAAPGRRVVVPTASRRVWVVERFGLFDADREVFLGADGAGPYRVSEDLEAGRFRLIGLEKIAAHGEPNALAAHVERLGVAEVARGRAVDAKWRDGEFVFSGQTGGWRRVRKERARIGKLPVEMIWAHPRPGRTLAITAPLEGSPSHVTLVGGLADKAPEWRRSPVDVKVLFDGVRVGAKRFENAPGLFGASFAVPANAAEMRIEITARDTARRHFLLDAYFL